MEELLQKHRTFTLSVAIGGVVFILAVLMRGCAVYSRDLALVHAKVQQKARDLQDPNNPVPDEKYLKDLEAVVQAADARVAELARKVGRTEQGERLWEECIGDILSVVGQDTPEKRRDIMDRARKLPSAAFSLMVENARTAFSARAAQNDVEIVPQEMGFESVREGDFSRYVAAMAAVVRVVDKAIALGVDRIETIAPSGGTEAGGGGGVPFVQSIPIRFKIRGEPAVLAELVKSLNDRDRDGKGRRLVLDVVESLGRPETVRPGDPGVVEFTVRVLLINLEAKEQ